MSPDFAPPPLEANPYAPPAADILKLPTDAERIREEHIKTESTLRTAGILYYLVGTLVTLSSISAVAGARQAGEVAASAVILTIGILFLVVGRGLRKLRRWVRVPTIIFSIIGLLAFPIGTLINGVILASVASKKAATVLTPQYWEIRLATPHVKQKTSKAVLVLLLILLGVFVLAMTLALKSSSD